MSTNSNTRSGFLITIAETKVITIDKMQTIVTMIRLRMNMRFSWFKGPDKKNDL